MGMNLTLLSKFNLKECIELVRVMNASISDPWYSERFDVAYREIREGCEGLMQYILEHDFGWK